MSHAVERAAVLATAALRVNGVERSIAAERSAPIGLALIVLGLAALVLAGPLASTALLVAGALLAGTGHGIGFLGAQDVLNRIAPGDRRGEVTAAFITCIYVLVGASVVAVGLLDLAVSLRAAVAIVAGVLACAAAGTACLQAFAAR